MHDAHQMMDAKKPPKEMTATRAPTAELASAGLYPNFCTQVAIVKGATTDISTCKPAPDEAQASAKRL